MWGGEDVPVVRGILVYSTTSSPSTAPKTGEGLRDATWVGSTCRRGGVRREELKTSGSVGLG